MDFQKLFYNGMKRDLPDLIEIDGLSFDLGASGKFKMECSHSLGLPDWSFPRDKIPAKNASVATVHAYHFLEHLTGDVAILLLREIERVLICGGVFNFCVPHALSHMQAQDITHKSNWNEDTFRNLFNNDYYDTAGEWKLKVHFIIVAGIVSRNLAVIGQIIKT